MLEINKDVISIFQQLPDSIIATVHKDPDFDAIGSLLALKEIGTFFKKKIDLYAPDIDLNQFLNLPHIKELIIKPKEKYELAIFLDCSDFNRIYKPDKFPKFKKSINIDHHQDNTLFGTYNFVENSSSVGEMLVSLFKALNIKVTQTAATNLYAAICFDTGGFRFSNTSAKTLKIAAELLETEIKPHQINEWIFENKSSEYFEDVRLGLNNIHIDKNNPFILVFIPYSNYQSKESTINFFRQLKNTELVVTCKETQPNTHKLSFRSKNKINVTNLAANFNGGGHIRAAGAYSKMPANKLKETLLELINKEFK